MSQDRRPAAALHGLVASFGSRALSGTTLTVPTTFQDYYAILGVPRTATQKEIKAAFRKLARKHHPDLNQNDPAAERRFKEANEANEVLSDPEKRRLYDEVGPRWREYEAWDKAGRPGPSPFGAAPGGGGGRQVEYRTVPPDELESMFGEADPFSDFFHSMFGRSGGRQRRVPARRGDDVEGGAEITLEEAYAGTSRTIELSGGGRTRRVEITIPAGVADGARVRAAGQGGAGGAGGAAGDLFVRVRVRPHPRVTRTGSDLQEQLWVPLDVALVGGEFLETGILRLRNAHDSLEPALADQDQAALAEQTVWHKVVIAAPPRADQLTDPCSGRQRELQNEHRFARGFADGSQ